MVRKEQLHTDRAWWVHDTVIQSYPIHWHTYFEAELITDGTGIQIINGIEEPIGRGSMTLLSPQDFHRLEASAGSSLAIRKFGVLPEFLSADICDRLAFCQPPYLLQLGESETEGFCTAFSRLSELDRETEPYQSLLARREIELLLIRMAQAVGNGQEVVSLPRSAQRDEEKIRILQPVLSYIDAHYAEPLHRRDLAQMIHVSPCYLSILFRTVLGFSLVDYITDTRMKRAKSLLHHTDTPIGQVIEEVGYDSPSLFYRKFSEYFGQSPGEYRKVKHATSSTKQ